MPALEPVINLHDNQIPTLLVKRLLGVYLVIISSLLYRAFDERDRPLQARPAQSCGATPPRLAKLSG